MRFIHRLKHCFKSQSFVKRAYKKQASNCKTTQVYNERRFELQILKFFEMIAKLRILFPNREMAFFQNWFTEYLWQKRLETRLCTK